MSTRLTPTQRTVQAYETYQDRYLQEWNKRTYKIPPHLKAWVAHLPKAGVLLDLGCGPGQDTRYLRRKGFHVHGVDLTWSFLQAAKTRAPRLPFIQADMQSLPFPRQVFDGVWAAASLIHLPKSYTRRVLRNVFRLTKPGGWIGITVMYGRRVGILNDQWIPGRYLAKWSKSELTQAVQAAKWEVESLEIVKNQERKGSWLNLLSRKPV